MNCDHRKSNSRNLEKCPRFTRCSANVCPLDSEAEERTYLPDEETCPFTVKKRNKSQKGLITRAPDHLLEVMPKSNLGMLHRANQKRWLALRKERDGVGIL